MFPFGGADAAFTPLDKGWKGWKHRRADVSFDVSFGNIDVSFFWSCWLILAEKIF